MEERGGKTIMCSVLFLDIAEYSKKSVAGQISLKDRFNSYLSAALSNVPITDRIILDTGDGAAVNFLGDVEDAVKTALALRESILNETPRQDPPLLVRAGINLGPVRLVRDINGQPNIVGDGINVAQRIMGFAEADQILVSRSYYDAVSRLSPQYAGMFSYLGLRTDKHVREHEIYSIGHLGARTAELIATELHEIQKDRLSVRLLAAARNGWNAIARGCNDAIGYLKSNFAQADSGQRALYVAAAVVLPVLLLGILVLKLLPSSKVPTLPGAEQLQTARSSTQPSAEGVMVAPAAPRMESKAGETPDTRHGAAAKRPDTKKPAEGKVASKKADEQAKQPPARPKSKAPELSEKKTWLEAIKGGAEQQGAEAYLSITCKEGTQLFVDGTQKGKVSGRTLTVAVPPGKHTVIVSSASGALHTQKVEVEAGKTMHLKPNFCD